MDLILSFASFKADKELKKGDGAKRQRLTGAWECCWNAPVARWQQLPGLAESC